MEITEGRPVSEASTSSKKKKSKLARKAKRERTAEQSTSTPAEKEAVLQEAFAEIAQDKAAKEAEAQRILQ